VTFPVVRGTGSRLETVEKITVLDGEASQRLALSHFSLGLAICVRLESRSGCDRHRAKPSLMTRIQYQNWSEEKCVH